jgi:hypothetical protein
MEFLLIRKKYEELAKDPTKAKEDFTKDFVKENSYMPTLFTSVTHDRPFLMKALLKTPKHSLNSLSLDPSS